MLLEPRPRAAFAAWAGVTDEEWNDWKWQFRNRISTPEQLARALYSCDHSEGLGHFRVPIERGLLIMESLVGHTSGDAVPVFVVDAPGGGGKIPLLPDYRVSDGVLRNFEGRHFAYRDADAPDRGSSGVCQTCGTSDAGERRTAAVVAAPADRPPLLGVVEDHADGLTMS